MRDATRPIRPARLSTYAEALSRRVAAAPGSPADVFERVLRPVPGWLMILGGLTLLGMAILTPSWLDLTKARWELKLMQLQSDRLVKQAERYAKFEQAVVERDPVLLERLAYTQLRLQQAERRVVSELASEGRVPNPAAGADLPPGDIDRWLAVQPPVVGVDLPAYAQSNTRLTRLTGEPLPRAVLLIVGCLSVFAGLWWGSHRSTPNQRTGNDDADDANPLRIRDAA